MKTATISEIKRELKDQDLNMLIDLCLRLAKFKKDNKELLHYLLYESQNEESYVSIIKDEVDEDFELLNISSLYLAKKTIRKVLRKLNKYIKYSGKPKTEIELNSYFLFKLITCGLEIKKSKVLVNIFNRRLDLINKALKKIHPDLQYDFELEIQDLRSFLQ